MKLNEIVQMDDEPMLITLIRQRLQKNQRIAIYYRSGDSVKPMWIERFRRVRRAARIGDLWVIVCNKGNNIKYLNYSHKDFDKRYELVPGKTKGTRQLTRHWENITEGIGNDVLEFSDHIHDPELHIPKKLIPLFEKLADMLFKGGWEWRNEDGEPNGAHFTKRPWQIVFPEKRWREKSRVRIYYHERIDLNKPAQIASEKYHIEDMLDNFEANLEEVKDMATS